MAKRKRWVVAERKVLAAPEPEPEPEAVAEPAPAPQPELSADERLAAAQAELAALLSTKGGPAMPREKAKAPSKSLAELRAQHEADLLAGRVQRGEIDEYYAALSKTFKETKEEIRRLARQRDLLKETTTEYVVVVPPGGLEGLGRKVVCLFTPDEVARLKRALEIADRFLSTATSRKAHIDRTTDLDLTLTDYITLCHEEAENADEAVRTKALEKGNA